jgi:ABC-type transport system involved in cytochrome bd biosynthesis fused ATPase/permease subunit
MLPPIWHGTLREHYLVLFTAAGLVALVVGAVAAWLGAQFGARRAAREAADLAVQGMGAAVDRRFELLQHAVESMAVEVERISEAQRFAARLLTERPPRVEAPTLAASRTELRIPTPH